MKDWEELEIDLADLEEEKFQKLELFLSQNWLLSEISLYRINHHPLNPACNAITIMFSKSAYWDKQQSAKLPYFADTPMTNSKKTC